MKKLLLVLSGVLLLSGCGVEVEKEEEVNLDQVRFEEEYESINGSEESDGVSYIDVDITDENKVKYIEADEAIDFLENGTGVLFFGFPECQWCRNLVPSLVEVIDDSQLDELYYFNALDIRDIKSLEDGEIVVDKEGDDDYYKIVELLNDHLDPYNGLEDEEIKRLYFPTVVYMLDGEISYVHKGTLDSHTNGDIKLTEEQKEELYNILYGEVVLVDGSVCVDEVETGC